MSGPWFGAALAISAFLLFLVQPILGRALLPWFGGSASLWTACMLVFQALLLLGYLYAHALTRLHSAAVQFRTHALVLVAGALLLPPLPGAAWRPATLDNPSAQAALLVLAVAGLPYLTLSTSAPLLQAWYARTFPGRSPYRLYAWSNASSLVALLSYPLIVEPLVPLRLQGQLWSALYLIFVAASLGCARLAAKGARAPGGPEAAAGPVGPRRTSPATPAPSLREMGMWLWLAMLASVLLLAVTNELCQDVAVVPFLWIVPLTLYLVTFVLCFRWERLYRRDVVLPLSLVSIWLIGKSSSVGANPPLWGDIAIWCSALFVFCLACHGELVRRKPPVAHLTQFYLAIALGGALGGVAVALVAPAVFSSFLELPAGFTAAVATVALLLAAGPSTARTWFPLPLSGTALGILYVVASGLVAPQARSAADLGQWVLEERRNFFGVARVQEGPVADGAADVRRLYSGRTLHGAQFLSGEKARVPTTYYSQQSGVGLAMAHLPDRAGRHIGVVGLGAGTMAAYGRAGDRLRFYEINPLVRDLSGEYFTFISGCPCQVDVVIGDARVRLENEPPQEFDLLVLDAFTGDAIPTHLLTVEAMQVYLRHLRPDGMLAVHITNAFMDLTPVLRALAQAEGLAGALVRTARDPASQANNARWVLLGRDRRLVDQPWLADASSPRWQDAAPVLWTDDFASLAGILGRRP